MWKRKKQYRYRITPAPSARSPFGDHAAGPIANRIIFCLAMLAICYNALLATANAHGVHVGMPIVAVTELMILGTGIGVIAATGLRRSDALPFAIVIAISIIALTMSLAWDHAFPDPIRNFGIIAIFTMLGTRVDERMLRRIFLVATLIIGLFLGVEIASLPTYVSIFQPAMYLESTRGVAQFSLNTTGLFANALGYAGRFSFGLYDGPRTSSVFLEQVSLAGYSAVLSIYILCMWSKLSWIERALHCLLVVAILVTNNTRTASVLAAICIPAYFIYPRLPKHLTFLVGPAILLTALIVVKAIFISADVSNDDLAGRLALTIEDLSGLSASDLLIGNIPKVQSLYDSGYTYLICSTSVFGLIVFWYYISRVSPPETPSAMRATYSTALYLCLWLCIGGTAIFTIKTSSLLWLLLGRIRREALGVRIERGDKLKSLQTGLRYAA